MPRITIEEKVEISPNVNEVKSTIYDLKDTIVYNGVVMSYDSYHQCYMSADAKTYITPIAYIKHQLKEAKTKKSCQNNDGMEQ